MFERRKIAPASVDIHPLETLILELIIFMKKHIFLTSFSVENFQLIPSGL